MAQPSIPGTAVGIPRMAYGNDGTNWIAVLVDALGHIQADILSTVLPTDAAKETKQDTMITALQLIDDLRAALGSVNTDDLQVDVKTSALPTDAATQTTLASALTALQLIDDLRAALASVATDRLLVASKSGDKIFGFESIVQETFANENLSAGSNLLSGTAVPAGKVWKITFAGIFYEGTVPTNTDIVLVGAAGALWLLNQPSPASARWYIWTGEAYLQAGDYMRGSVAGATTGDDLYFRYGGVQMNAP